MFVVCVCMLASCAQSTVMREGRAVPREEAAQADLLAAADAVERGDDADARRRLETFLEEFPGSSRVDEARFLLAETLLKTGEAERAARTWRELVEQAPLSPRAAEARLRAARVYRDLGDPATGQRLLAGVDPRRTPEDLRAEVQRTQFELSRAIGDFPGAVAALSARRDYEKDRQKLASLDADLDELLKERLRDDELEALLLRLEPGVVQVRATLELARRRTARGDYPSALALLEPLDGLPEAEERARTRLIERARRGEANELFTIGLEVPLSGPFAPYGRSVLRGAALALDLFTEAPAQFRLVVRDPASDAAGAEGAARALIQEGVRAIIGPLGSTPSLESAPVAGAAGIPMLALTVRPDLPYAGSGVFRTGVASSEQIRVLVEFAMEAMEAQRFAILYPDDAYGSEYKSLLWDEVERRGGSIVGVEPYDPVAVDFQDPIRKLVGLYYVTADEVRRIERREQLSRRRDQNREELAAAELADLPPYVDFDALFIPDSASRVGLILPQLRFYDVTDVILLGSSDWNDAKLLEVAAREAEGALFVSAFDVASQKTPVQEFVAAYRAAYGDAPDAYAAQGYETASLLRSIVQEGTSPTPQELTESLQGLASEGSTFRPIAGLEGFDTSGGAMRELSVLTVRGKQIREYGASRAATVGNDSGR
jgi:ABC-type branched-subunit amino acid transport system substrate-binding protein